ncbi:MAG: ABC transporter substrate-binding protein [Actinomycetota bacterium]
MKRLVAVILALGVFASACGDDTDDGEPSSTSAAAEVQASGSSSASESTADPEPEDAPAAGEPGGGEEAAVDGEAATFEVETFLGRQEVSVATDGILALDETTGLVLLALGVAPQSVTVRFNDTISLGIMADAGVAALEFDNLEQVAADAPQVMIGIDAGDDAGENAALYAEIAPFLTPVDPADTPWQEQIRFIALITGTEARGEQLIGRIEGRLAAVREQLATSELAGASVSLLSDLGDAGVVSITEPFIAPEFLAQIGLTRPAAQQTPADGGVLFVSEELVPDQVADVLIAVRSPFAPPGEPAAILDNPLLPEYDLVAEVEGIAWATPGLFSLWWVIADLEAIFVGVGDVTGVGDVDALWSELIAP